MIRQTPKPVTIGRSTARGGRCITSISCGSNEMTRPSATEYSLGRIEAFLATADKSLHDLILRHRVPKQHLIGHTGIRCCTPAHALRNADGRRPKLVSSHYRR